MSLPNGINFLTSQVPQSVSSEDEDYIQNKTKLNMISKEIEKIRNEAKLEISESDRSNYDKLAKLETRDFELIPVKDEKGQLLALLREDLKNPAPYGRVNYYTKLKVALIVEKILAVEESINMLNGWAKKNNNEIFLKTLNNMSTELYRIRHPH